MANQRIQQLALRKRENIHELEGQIDEPLVMQLPDVNLLFTLEELGYLLSDLIGLKSPTDDRDRILDLDTKECGLSFRLLNVLVILSPLKAVLFRI